MNVLNIIQTKLVAPKGQFNAFGKYKYRSCEDILESLKPLLKETEATLTITDEIVMIGERYYVKATAKLRKGDREASVVAYAREEEEKKGMDKSQITGAASSYARKYALNGLFCIDDNKDADTTNSGTTEIILYDEVLSKLKTKFKTLDEKKVWFDAKGIKTPIKDMTKSELNTLLDLLNELS
jgi:ATP:corrinoid adenosyltransferase